jgi:hypothetical protein
MVTKAHKKIEPMKKDNKDNPAGAGEDPATGSDTIGAPEGGDDHSSGDVDNDSGDEHENPDPSPEGGDGYSGSNQENPDPSPESSKSDPNNGEGSESTETNELKAVPVFALDEDVIIVVCGTSESISLLDKAWTEKATPATIMSMNVDGMSFRDIIENLISDDGLPDTIFLVPASCFPTHRVSLADLIAYKVRVMKKGERRHATGLPTMLDMAVAIEVLEKFPEGDLLTEEDFWKAYNEIAHEDEVPVETGHFTPGTVTFAVSSAPCRSVIAEGLARRKYINATPEAFRAIETMLTEFYE